MVDQQVSWHKAIPREGTCSPFPPSRHSRPSAVRSRPMSESIAQAVTRCSKISGRETAGWCFANWLLVFWIVADFSQCKVCIPADGSTPLFLGQEIGQPCRSGGWDRDLRARHRGVALVGVGTACNTKMDASEDAACQERQERGGDVCLIRIVRPFTITDEPTGFEPRFRPVTTIS